MSHNDDLAAKLGRLMSDARLSGHVDPNDAACLLGEARQRQDKLKHTAGVLQESLDQLRVSVKYLVFDLEATRRENQYLRKLLDAGGSGDGRAGAD